MIMDAADDNVDREGYMKSRGGVERLMMVFEAGKNRCWVEKDVVEDEPHAEREAVCRESRDLPVQLTRQCQ